MKKNHPTQEQILELLKDTSASYTIRDLQDILDISSPSVVHHHIQQLERKGLLFRNPDNPRDYQVRDPEFNRELWIGVYGLAQCGVQGKMVDGNAIERLPLSRELLPFSEKDALLVIASGDSMEPRIHEGDYVLVEKKQEFRDKDIILCSVNEETMIKQFVQRVSGDDIHNELHSLNQKYSPIALNDQLFLPVGRVRGILNFSL